jgi:hypothetical protein
MVESNNQMRPNFEMLESLQAQFQVATAPKQVTLDGESLVSGYYDEFYSCLICSSIVWD